MATDNSKNQPDSEDEITQLTPEEILDQEQLDQDAKQLKELEEKLKAEQDKFLRTYADFENYRKRVAKEKEELSLITSEKLLRELLEVKDHLELALSHSKDSPDMKSLKEGVVLTLRQLNKFLEKFGVKEIDALGQPFNPSYHEAVQEEASVEFNPGTVVQVYQKGYMFHERLLRPARVSVAKEKT